MRMSGVPDAAAVMRSASAPSGRATRVEVFELCRGVGHAVGQLSGEPLEGALARLADRLDGVLKLPSDFAMEPAMHRRRAGS